MAALRVLPLICLVLAASSHEAAARVSRRDARKTAAAAAAAPGKRIPAVVPAKAPGARQLCPAPLSVCDLYYGARAAVVPLRANTSSVIISDLPVKTKSGDVVQSLSTSGAACVVIGNPALPCKNTITFFNSGIANKGNPVALGTLPMTLTTAKSLAGKCIKLGVTNFLANDVWYNFGDNKVAYPVGRRCILIQT